MDSLRHLINVSYYIKPGHRIRIGRITISGNTAAHTDVIHRALKIREHQLYSPKAFRESEDQLNELGTFHQAKITTQPSDKPNEIDVNVIVVEKSRKTSLLDTWGEAIFKMPYSPG
jgi:outer membrane protein assembly factor BamA